MTEEKKIAPTTEQRLDALEAQLADDDPDYIRVPKWAMQLGFAALVLTLALAAVTFGPLVAQPAALSAAVPHQAAVVTPAPIAPRTITSASRTLGDPNARVALVEWGDFQ